MAKKKGQHLKSKGIRGDAPSKAEYEQRLRIVERCLAVGIFQDTAIQLELEKQNRKVAIRTVRDYTSIVRKRLKEEDEELRNLRKTLLIRDIKNYEQVVFDKLVKNKTKPRWSDLTMLIRLRQDIEAGKVDRLPEAPPIVEAETVDEFETIDEAEADRRLQRLFEQVGVPDEYVTKH